MINRAMMTSKTCEWETPQAFFDELNSKYYFATDVCATAENAKCAHYYTREQDGLAQVWSGTCWMNPPYGREIGKWVRKRTNPPCWERRSSVCCPQGQTRHGGMTFVCPTAR